MVDPVLVLVLVQDVQEGRIPLRNRTVQENLSEEKRITIHVYNIVLYMSLYIYRTSSVRNCRDPTGAGRSLDTTSHRGKPQT